MKPNSPNVINSVDSFNKSLNAFWTRAFTRSLSYYTGRLVNNKQFLAEGNRETNNSYASATRACLTYTDIN